MLHSVRSLVLEKNVQDPRDDENENLGVEAVAQSTGSRQSSQLTSGSGLLPKIRRLVTYPSLHNLCDLL